MIKTENLNNHEKKSNSYSILTLSVGIYIATVFIFSANVELNFISQLAFLLMAGCSGLYLMMNKRVYKLSIATVWMLGVFLLSFFSVAWSVNVAYSIKNVITVGQLVLLGIFVHILVDNDYKLNLIIDSVIWSGYFMYLYMFVSVGFDEMLILINENMRIGDEVNQQNAFGYYSSLVFAFALYKAVYQRKWWYILFLPLPIMMGLFSGSKKCLLLLVVSAFIIIALKKKNQIVRRTVYAVLIIAASILLLYRLGYMDLVLGRTQEALQGVDISTNERQRFIEFGLEKIKERPLFGYGIEQYSVLYRDSFYVLRPSHNNYIQILTSFGAIGFVLWYSAYAYFFVVGVKNFYKNDLAPMLVFLSVITIVNDFTTTTLINKFTYVLIAFCFGIASTIKKEQMKAVERDE